MPGNDERLQTGQHYVCSVLRVSASPEAQNAPILGAIFVESVERPEQVSDSHRTTFVHSAADVTCTLGFGNQHRGNRDPVQAKPEYEARDFEKAAVLLCDFARGRPCALLPFRLSFNET